MLNTNDMTTIKLKKGTYWVGDPVYIMEDEEREELFVKTDYFRRIDVFEYRGCPFASTYVYGGDDIYWDNDSFKYIVDSATLCIIQVDNLNLTGIKNRLDNVGRFEYFKEDFEVKINPYKFDCGKFEIDLLPEDIDDDYYD